MSPAYSTTVDTVSKIEIENNSRASSSLFDQAGTPQQSLGRSQQDTGGHSLIEVLPLRRAEAVVAHHEQPMSGENEESLSRSVLGSHLGSNGRIVFAADGVFRDGDRVHL